MVRWSSKPPHRQPATKQQLRQRDYSGTTDRWRWPRRPQPGSGTPPWPPDTEVPGPSQPRPWRSVEATQWPPRIDSRWPTTRCMTRPGSSAWASRRPGSCSQAALSLRMSELRILLGLPRHKARGWKSCLSSCCEDSVTSRVDSAIGQLLPEETHLLSLLAEEMSRSMPSFGAETRDRVWREAHLRPDRWVTALRLVYLSDPTAAKLLCEIGTKEDAAAMRTAASSRKWLRPSGRPDHPPPGSTGPPSRSRTCGHRDWWSSAAADAAAQGARRSCASFHRVRAWRALATRPSMRSGPTSVRTRR